MKTKQEVLKAYQNYLSERERLKEIEDIYNEAREILDNHYNKKGER
ncbi:hypothetical protein GCM10009038_08760 [Salinicola rhizosphaerae]|uniref:Lacal_2735 family protein n=1 Tax=Salinicola rhizosphaerae TaxID=1443141 RepID=A0ABQ3DSJ9_9GAMM|nr:hypothetical protein GCM10009038_08760 [Salinicola rhizosphaerae]